MDQSELELNKCNRRQARKNANERGTVGFGSHWLKKWREFVNQSQSAGKQNRSIYQITFDTQLKTAICCMLLPFAQQYILQKPVRCRNDRNRGI